MTIVMTLKKKIKIIFIENMHVDEIINTKNNKEQKTLKKVKEYMKMMLL